MFSLELSLKVELERSVILGSAGLREGVWEGEVKEAEEGAVLEEVSTADRPSHLHMSCQSWAGALGAGDQLLLHLVPGTASLAWVQCSREETRVLASLSPCSLQSAQRLLQGGLLFLKLWENLLILKIISSSSFSWQWFSLIYIFFIFMDFFSCIIWK